MRALQNPHYFKKSLSLGSELFLEGRVPRQIDTDDETDHGSSSDFRVHGLVEDDRKLILEGDPQLSEKDGHDFSDLPLHYERANDSSYRTPNNAPGIVKSCSMPNIAASSLISEGSPKCLTHRSRSSEDVHVLRMRQKDILDHDVDTELMREQERDDGMHTNNKTSFESYEGFESYSCSASAKDRIAPVSDEVKILREEPACPSEESKDTFELSHPKDQVRVEPAVLNGLTAAKVDVKTRTDIEAAKRYISYLPRKCNRITAGALPRGLHMLDLSRNNISTIESLHELTRLRVLNLSYNRIFRIGHELYLAGNKISEVEGLHRLLKLMVLDLRFNKISTVKCLGQLAANYNSLLAISLEGNPARKNVEDEYLKKHLQGLLPNSVYFNRQAIKVKDAIERSVKLGISSHQLDRSYRSEHRGTREHNHGTVRASSSSHKSQAIASPMRSRSRHGRLPLPSGNKATANHRNHYVDLGNKLLNFILGVSMRRTQSNGSRGQL
ncbi:Adenine nucleotide alpha hydrolases-like superfamily protein isoform 1 [Hibiscus syriacus]|uniref:Adenine nucleotide alpha hydrolases-like superfamily protein isoform 1 n=1 Tax=Hibiscus syriacus TaxID=106335 RepID=A0A6A2X0R8_HIBSY|nr:Adenine nucleotide alpha hydrolases-like superfamily protein isoform 1 [Hibiscus syriacus]